MKPRKNRVYKVGFLLSRQETPTKQNDAPESISADLSAYTGFLGDGHYPLDQKR
ncbi:hypothetical protein FC99_GL002030 [Levilactobacillus koreensis JCM 16448]|nr:hypothetical protein FC99_GL002030 [Levilactobacillus koreensis JCM 16448]